MMVNPIGGGPPAIPALPRMRATSESSESSFRDFLMQSIQEVNGMQKDADRAVESLMSGGDANPAEVLTAVQKADLAFRMMIQVRNKLVQGFDEMRNLRI